jgi:hypothetical protein
VISTAEEEGVRKRVESDLYVRFVSSDAAGHHAEALIRLEEVGRLVDDGRLAGS